MAGESVTDGAEKKNNLEEESDPGQTHVEVGKGQVETRIGVPAYQQASELLASVNKTLDGLEDDLIKHAEELEASTLSEDFVFSGVGDFSVTHLRTLYIIFLFHLPTNSIGNLIIPSKCVKCKAMKLLG